jgi:hypothetical protein
MKGSVNTDRRKTTQSPDAKAPHSGPQAAQAHLAQTLNYVWYCPLPFRSSRRLHPLQDLPCIPELNSYVASHVLPHSNLLFNCQPCCPYRHSFIHCYLLSLAMIVSITNFWIHLPQTQRWVLFTDLPGPRDLPTSSVIHTGVAILCPATGGYATTPGVPRSIFL